MTKMWKSDGPETKQLEKLFREGKISANAKPSDIQKKYPIFTGFSSAVFRKHFGLSREKCCATASDYGSSSLLDLITDEEYQVERDADLLTSEPAEKKFRAENVNEIEFVQSPIIPCVYTDPTTKQEKCLVVVALLDGVKELHFDLVNKGKEQNLVVSYEWPEETFSVASMFKNDKDGTMLVEPLNPKLLAVEEALKKYRQNIEDAPTATITIKLPTEVCTDPKSWKYTYNKKKGGNVIMFIELECIRKAYVIAKSEKCIKIE